MDLPSNADTIADTNPPAALSRVVRVLTIILAVLCVAGLVHLLWQQPIAVYTLSVSTNTQHDSSSNLTLNPAQAIRACATTASVLASSAALAVRGAAAVVGVGVQALAAIAMVTIRGDDRDVEQWRAVRGNAAGALAMASSALLAPPVWAVIVLVLLGVPLLAFSVLRVFLPAKILLESDTAQRASVQRALQSLIDHLNVAGARAAKKRAAAKRRGGWVSGRGPASALTASSLDVCEFLKVSATSFNPHLDPPVQEGTVRHAAAWSAASFPRHTDVAGRTTPPGLLPTPHPQRLPVEP